MKKLGIGLGFLLLVTLGVSPELALIAKSHKAPPLTTFEQKVATRCELLYGENARPHVMLHGHVGSMDEWLAKPDSLRRVLNGRFGVHVLFKNKGDYVNGDAQVGVPPVDGRLEWVDPDRIKRAVQFIHDLDPGRIALFYLHPGAFRSAGLSAGQIVDEIVRQCREYGWKGVYLDGLTLGANIHETIAALARLKGEGILTIGHVSVHPHQDARGWCYGPGDIQGGLVDWMQIDLVRLLDVVVWGEGNDVSDDAAGMALLKRVSSVASAPRLLFVWQPKVGGAFHGNPDQHMPVGVDMLMTDWSTPTNLHRLEVHRLPAYEAARAEYLADPDAYVRALARDW